MRISSPHACYMSRQFTPCRPIEGVELCDVFLSH